MTIDFKRVQNELYLPVANKFSLINVPKMNFVMIDGKGDPNISQEYAEAIEALYAVSYALKFFSKRELDKDYVVPPLEGLWWSDDMTSFIRRDKAAWQYTMMIRVPEWLERANVKQAIKTVAAKKPALKVDRLRFESLTEGLCVQRMHIGSYDDETPTLLELHNEWLPQNGYEPTIKHHEIYLNDPRKTVAAKLKTGLRQPIKKI